MATTIFRRMALRPLNPPTPFLRPFSTRPFLLQQQQHQQPQQPVYEPANPPQAESEPERPNPHRDVYKSGGAGRAIAYNFLVAMVTFQALYWGWTKLESLEIKREKWEEVGRLEGELRGLVGGKK